MLAGARMGGFFQPETVEADFAYWAKMPEWTEREAAALLCGLNPYYVAKLNPDYVADGPPAAYFGLMELAQRAIIAGLIGRPYTPARWLAWAKKYDHPIPQDLEAEIGRLHARVADLATKTDDRLSGVEGSPPAPPPSDDDVRALIRTAIAQNGGYITQKKGAEIVRQKYPGFNKERAMALVKELTKSDKPGPKGPRNNCPK
jgi:hypothetical protein